MKKLKRELRLHLLKFYSVYDPYRYPYDGQRYFCSYKTQDLRTKFSCFQLLTGARLHALLNEFCAPDSTTQVVFCDPTGPHRVFTNAYDLADYTYTNELIAQLAGLT